MINKLLTAALVAASVSVFAVPAFASGTADDQGATPTMNPSNPMPRPPPAPRPSTPPRPSLPGPHQ